MHLKQEQAHVHSCLYNYSNLNGDIHVEGAEHHGSVIWIRFVL